VGTILRPTAETGRDPRGLGDLVADRVAWTYISPDRAIAKKYARLVPGGGDVYQVEPNGEVDVDPLGLRLALTKKGTSFVRLHFCPVHFCCSSARIVRRLDEIEIAYSSKTKTTAKGG
jgi:hypothetical protein